MIIQEFKKIPVVCDVCLQYMCGGPEDVFQKLVLPSIVSSRIDLGWSGLRSKHLLIELSQQQSFKSFNVFFNFFYDVFIRLFNSFINSLCTQIVLTVRFLGDYSIIS